MIMSACQSGRYRTVLAQRSPKGPRGYADWVLPGLPGGFIAVNRANALGLLPAASVVPKGGPDDSRAHSQISPVVSDRSTEKAPRPKKGFLPA
jgi:hypothetical protein